MSLEGSLQPKNREIGMFRCGRNFREQFLISYGDAVKEGISYFPVPSPMLLEVHYEIAEIIRWLPGST